jgi:PAS domain S-box-containing protein
MESAANFAVYRLVFDPAAPGRFRVVFVSPSISDIIGLADPMKFETWFENIHPDDTERIAEASRRAFKILKFDERFRIYHQVNRNWCWIRAISTYIPDQDGRSKYVNGILFDISEAKKTEQQLETRTRHVEEGNAALKVLLRQREADKSELEEKVVSSVKDLIEPFLEKLKDSRLNEDQKTYINILESNLQDIISPFARRMSSRYLNFTPAEMQIANLIKQGKTTKELANTLNLSGRTISFHRENIREKLGLKNQSANLRSHLLSLE